MQYSSPYVYVGNNPVRLVDPTGMWVGFAPKYYINGHEAVPEQANQLIDGATLRKQTQQQGDGQSQEQARTESEGNSESDNIVAIRASSAIGIIYGFNGNIYLVFQPRTRTFVFGTSGGLTPMTTPNVGLAGELSVYKSMDWKTFEGVTDWRSMNKNQNPTTLSGSFPGIGGLYHFDRDHFLSPIGVGLQIGAKTPILK